jgi:hypothetical protein
MSIFSSSSCTLLCSGRFPTRFSFPVALPRLYSCLNSFPPPHQYVLFERGVILLFSNNCIACWCSLQSTLLIYCSFQREANSSTARFLFRRRRPSPMAWWGHRTLTQSKPGCGCSQRDETPSPLIHGTGASATQRRTRCRKSSIVNQILFIFFSLDAHIGSQARGAADHSCRAWFSRRTVHISVSATARN